jgi:hypothetical protein
MSNDPINLDEHRGASSRLTAKIRQQLLRDFQIEQTELRLRQDELESILSSAPSETWTEVADKAQYLLKLYAVSPEAKDPHRQSLIARTLSECATARRMNIHDGRSGSGSRCISSHTSGT